MGQLRDRMVEDLKLAGYSPETAKVYLHYGKAFTKHFRRSPSELGEKEVRSFLLHLLEVRRLGHGSYRQCFAALKFLYRVTLKRPFEVESIPRPRTVRRLPNVLSGTEVEALLRAFEHPKYRVVSMVMYAAGLRVSEACRLKVDDIDSKRMLLHVRQGKGNQDRSVMLSHRLLENLRRYWRVERPSEYLFPSSRAPHLCPASVRQVMRRVAKKAGLKKRVYPHLLRHSFATHLVEMGVDVTVIQALLGHRYLAATSRYTQVSRRHIQRLESPLDLLGTPKGLILG